MAEQLMIQGHVFTVADRYSDGDEINANEASALNQTRRENLRNNFASKVSEKLDGRESLTDDELAELQGEFDTYAESYEFGVHTGGGRASNPVMTEAMSIARGKVLEYLKQKGHKQKDIKAATITEKARELIAKYPQIMELAKKRIAETQAAAASELEDVMASVA